MLRPHTLHEVLNSPSVAGSTTLLECARRADGAAAVIVASSKFIQENLSDSPNSGVWNSPVILGNIIRKIKFYALYISSYV
jgi:acetyl-CoA acetyltransferase